MYLHCFLGLPILDERALVEIQTVLYRGFRPTIMSRLHSQHTLSNTGDVRI